MEDMNKNIGAPWNEKELRERFFIKQDQIDRDLAQLRKHKIPSDSSYKGFYDEQLGAFQVYSRLSVAAALAGRQSLLSELRELQSNGPFPPGDAFDQARVALGFNKAINQLIFEFDDK
jgi:hypothetical protein